MSGTYKLAHGIEHNGTAYRAKLTVKGERIELGCYPSLKLAQIAQNNAKKYYLEKMVRV